MNILICHILTGMVKIANYFTDKAEKQPHIYRGTTLRVVTTLLIIYTTFMISLILAEVLQFNILTQVRI